MAGATHAVGSKTYVAAQRIQMAERPAANPVRVSDGTGKPGETQAVNVQQRGNRVSRFHSFDRERVEIRVNTDQVEIANKLTGHSLVVAGHKGIFVDVSG